MLCRALEERLHSRAVFQAKATTELRFAHWRATDRTRRRLPNGGLRWASEDGIAQFELPHHRRFFRVTLPVAVPHAADKSRTQRQRSGAMNFDSLSYNRARGPSPSKLTGLFPHIENPSSYDLGLL